MPKAVALIEKSAVGPSGAITLNYSVSVNLQNGTGVEFSAEAPAGETSGLTITQWRDAAKDRVIADCAGKGITIVRADVSICSGPMA